MQLIEDYNLPSVIKNSMIANNNEEMYSELGATGFYKYVSAYITRLVVSACTFVVLLLLLRLLFVIVYLFMKKLIMSIPILAGVDRVGGMIFGLCAGIFVIWIFMIFASLFFGAEYDTMIADSTLLTKLDETNLIMRLIMK